MKTIKKFVKKAFTVYCNNMYQTYKSCIDAGINPFM